MKCFVLKCENVLVTCLRVDCSDVGIFLNIFRAAKICFCFRQSKSTTNCDRTRLAHRPRFSLTILGLDEIFLTNPTQISSINFANCARSSQIARIAGATDAARKHERNHPRSFAWWSRRFVRSGAHLQNANAWAVRAMFAILSK